MSAARDTAQPAHEADLFVWREVDDIEKQRERLVARMRSHKPHSMARAELAIRLRNLTAEALKLEGQK